jgi:hypothetical protein
LEPFALVVKIQSDTSYFVLKNASLEEDPFGYAQDDKLLKATSLCFSASYALVVKIQSDTSYFVLKNASLEEDPFGYAQDDKLLKATSLCFLRVLCLSG